MAEKNDNIVCSICLGDFSKPKLIDCHHCFCLKCLDGYAEKFTVDNHFPCPLCRRKILIPAGGVQDFATNFYIKESSCSTGDGQRNQDFCSNHHEKGADIYCKDCSVAVCWRCYVKSHNGHQCVDLSDDETLQQFCEELKTINQDFINQISKLKNYSDSLEVKMIEVSETADKICSEVDNQILKIYLQLKSLGEKTKIRVNDWKNEETEKLNTVNKEKQMECENVEEIVNNSDDILENKSFVQLIEILPNIRKQQKKQNQRKLDIPVVKSIKFVQGKINSDILSQQIGILERPSLEVGILERPSLEVGETFCFMTNFNVSQVKLDDDTWKPADGDDVIPWTVGVRRVVRLWIDDDEGGWLIVVVKLENITDKTIQRVDVKMSHKLINNKNDSQSVSEEYNEEISPGGRVVGYCRLLIEYKTLNNKQNGFLDSNNNFTIQTAITITGVSR